MKKLITDPYEEYRKNHCKDCGRHKNDVGGLTPEGRCAGCAAKANEPADY